MRGFISFTECRETTTNILHAHEIKGSNQLSQLAPRILVSQ